LEFGNVRFPGERKSDYLAKNPGSKAITNRKLDLHRALSLCHKELHLAFSCESIEEWLLLGICKALDKLELPSINYAFFLL